MTHAGTARAPDGTIVTAGGRVLNVTGVRPRRRVGPRAAYAAAGMISFEGMQLRGDIAAGAGAVRAAGSRSIESWLTEWSAEEQEPSWRAAMGDVSPIATPLAEVEMRAQLEEIDVDAPRVGIVMGSESDMETMEKAARELRSAASCTSCG